MTELIPRFNPRSRKWHVFNGFKMLKAWGTFPDESAALAAIASYKSLPPGAAPVNLLAAVRAHTVNIFTADHGDCIALGADLREAFGDEHDAYREALTSLIETGEAVAGGGAAPAFLLMVAS